MRVKRKEVFYSEPGSHLKQTYTAAQLPDGNFNLVPGEIIDIQEEIDSHAESCSIENIIAMCASGDTSALNRVQGTFVDTTQMPKTFRDVLDIVIRGQSEFDRLPLEIRQKFDSNFVSWFQDAGSAEWMEKMGFKPAAPDTIEKKEVIQNAES